MKKSHKFDELSDRKCETPGCRKRIKERLKDKNKICYGCYQKKMAAAAASKTKTWRKNHTEIVEA